MPSASALLTSPPERQRAGRFTAAKLL